MSTIEVTVEAAFDVGVLEGRKQMAAQILEILQVTNDAAVVERYVNGLLKVEKDTAKIREMIVSAKVKTKDS